MWCDHAMLGRRYFERGEIKVRHCVAVVETSFESNVDIDASELDPRSSSPPICLVSIDDFLAVISYLRTWNDLERYLTTRLGAEHSLLGYYTAMRDTFDDWRGIAEAKLVLAAGKHIREGSAFRDQERALSKILEQFVSGLSQARSIDLPSEAKELQQHMDASDQAKSIVRDEFCDLTIQERAALGEQLGHLCSRIARESEPLYSTLRIERRRTTIYIFVVGWEEDPADLNLAAFDIMIA
ncbi:MAG TPA: hypothetical protein VFQ65_19390, partial [Kofleriaceae bacterium]|nr:hypothetical protein [Kofleriaceae bacterium]